MPLIVQKYGGSSVGTAEKIKAVARRIIEARKQGSEVVVVVSAMGDTTDELLALSKQVTENQDDREMDMLLSAGERISMALLSMALRSMGQEAISFTGSQAGIITDESHTRARILEIRPFRVLEEVKKGKVVIVAGFQGVSRTKEVTTLGRGGSDTTAVALAAALKAERCEVLTDVPGIFSADPRVVSNARRYEKLPLDLVFEMAVNGAQVMHARSIEIAREKRFSLFVGSSMTKEGTVLTADGLALELPKVVAVTARKGLRRYHIGKEQASALLEAATKDSVLTYELRWDAASGLQLVLDPQESAPFIAKNGLKPLGPELCAVTLVGYQLQQNAAMAHQIEQLLSRHSIAFDGLTTHPQSITVWIPGPGIGDDPTATIKLLHDALVR